MLIRPGVLLNRHSNAGAMALARTRLLAGNADGVTFSRAGKATYPETPILEADDSVPRFDTNGMLVSEGILTNSLRNPRAEGAVSPATLPTNWTMSLPAGITSVVTPYSGPNGVTGIDVALSGTASGSGQIFFETTTQVVAAAGQAWVASVYNQLIAGSLSNFGMQIGIRQGDATGAFVADSPALLINPTATLTRRMTVLASAAAGTARVASRVFFLFNGAVNATVRIIFPNLVNAGFNSSAILPVVGALVTSVRATDQAIRAANANPFTVGVRFLIPEAYPSGGNYGIWQRDDGTNSNRIGVFYSSAAGQIIMVTVIGGTVVATTPLGAVTPGVMQYLAVDANGTQITAKLRNGTLQTVNSAIPPGINTDRYGNSNAAFTAPMFGRIGPVDLYPQPVGVDAAQLGLG